jgi:hypothetical protein
VDPVVSKPVVPKGRHAKLFFIQVPPGAAT